MVHSIRRCTRGLLQGRRGVLVWLMGTFISSTLTLAQPPTAPNAISRAPNSKSAVKTVDVVILSTMLADRFGIGEWGFAALVEADGHRILFDTGARPELDFCPF